MTGITRYQWIHFCKISGDFGIPLITFFSKEKAIVTFNIFKNSNALF